MNVAVLVFTMILPLTSFAASFEDFPAAAVNLPSLPPLHGEKLSLFRNRVQELLKDYQTGKVKPLAHRYLLAQVGCGTECVFVIGVDLQTGQFKILRDIFAFEWDYRPNSRLLVVNKGGYRLYNHYPEEHFLFDDDFNARPLHFQATKVESSSQL